MQAARFEVCASDVEVVLDTVGVETMARCLAVLKPGGVLISSAAQPDHEEAGRRDILAVFFLANVTAAGLARIADLIASGHLKASVGEVLPLAEARLAHEMLAGKSHGRGKIVLSVHD